MHRQYYGLYVSNSSDSIEVLNYVKSCVLYRAKLLAYQRELSISRPSIFAPYHELFALVIFPRFSPNIIIQRSHGKSLTLYCHSIFRWTHKLTVAGKQLTWSNDGLRANTMKLQDEMSGQTIAICQRHHSARGRKIGDIIIFEKLPAATIDWIIVSAFAKIGCQWIAKALKS